MVISHAQMYVLPPVLAESFQTKVWLHQLAMICFTAVHDLNLKLKLLIFSSQYNAKDKNSSLLAVVSYNCVFCSEFKNKLYHGRLHNLVVNDSMYGSLVIHYIGHTATHRQATYVGSYSMAIHILLHHLKMMPFIRYYCVISWQFHIGSLYTTETKDSQYLFKFRIYTAFGAISDIKIPTGDEKIMCGT